jgi:predicted ATPase
VLEPRSDNRKTIAFRQAVASIWLLRLNPYAMESTSRREAEWLARDGSNFTSWLRSVIQEDPAIAALLSADLAKVFPGFRALRFAKMGAEARELIFDFEAEGVSGSYTLTPGDLSEGQRVLLMLYGVLHAAGPRAQVFGFDEPENFVALPEIQPWLQKVSMLVRDRGAQAFMVSHNPEVIDYLASEHVLVLSRPGGGPTRVRPLDVARDSGVSASRWLALGNGQ